MATRAAERLRGGGCTRILEGGRVFERAGIGFSDVAGDALPPSASAARPQLAGRGFEALGVSLVLHPRNPYCPTVHMNVRMLIATKPGEARVLVRRRHGSDTGLRFRGRRPAFPPDLQDALDPFGVEPTRASRSGATSISS